MTTSKTIVCPCEDVDDVEVREAVAAGYRDIESLKRYTGLATGPCQGKACLLHCRRILAEELDLEPGEAGVITFRPPVQPVTLAHLAGGDADDP